MCGPWSVHAHAQVGSSDGNWQQSGTITLQDSTTGAGSDYSLSLGSNGVVSLTASSTITLESAYDSPTTPAVLIQVCCE